MKRKIVNGLQYFYAIARGQFDQNLNGLQTLALAAMNERRQAPLATRVNSDVASAYSPAAPLGMDEYMQKLEALEPNAFPIWRPLFEAGVQPYESAPKDNCSVWGHRYAEAFRDFCAFHLKGRVLDIGSGPVGKPVYLAGYPSSHISAVEPLPVGVETDFELVRGFAEFLPWADGSFHTITAATSLDHVLSLDRAFAEIERVLVPGGQFLVWIGHVEGAPPYDPKQPGLKAIDSYHIFHFDKSWFEPLVSRTFEISEKLEFPFRGGANVFYRFVKR